MYAFPNVHDPKTGSMTHGMTLRDYFAAQAMQGLLAAETVGEYSNEHIADIAFVIADAMMKARDK